MRRQRRTSRRSSESGPHGRCSSSGGDTSDAVVTACLSRFGPPCDGRHGPPAWRSRFRSTPRHRPARLAPRRPPASAPPARCRGRRRAAAEPAPRSHLPPPAPTSWFRIVAVLLTGRGVDAGRLAYSPHGSSAGAARWDGAGVQTARDGLVSPAGEGWPRPPGGCRPSPSRARSATSLSHPLRSVGPYLAPLSGPGRLTPRADGRRGCCGKQQPITTGGEPLLSPISHQSLTAYKDWSLQWTCATLSEPPASKGGASSARPEATPSSTPVTSSSVLSSARAPLATSGRYGTSSPSCARLAWFGPGQDGHGDHHDE